MEILRNTEYLDFIADVKNNERKIVCYGTGLVLFSAEDMFSESGIDRNISLFIDGNQKKHEMRMLFSGRTIIIKGVDTLLTMDLSNTLLILTLETYEEVIDDLNQFRELDEFRCYIFSTINRSYIKYIAKNDFFCVHGYKERCGSERIPKVLHYCWFGDANPSDFMRKCIASWRDKCPDFEIILWNEDNFDVKCNNYVWQAYQSCKYAFVSDFARLDILYKHGGIYLDTDVKMLKSVETLLYHDAFISYNEWAVPNSAIIGSVPGNWLIKEMRDSRSEVCFINNDGSYNLIINSFYESAALSKYGFRKNFTYQIIEGMAIYPPCFFVQIGKYGIPNAEIDERTFAVHYAGGSWKG